MTSLLHNPEPLFRVDGQPVGLVRDALRLEVEETTAGLKTLQFELLAQGDESAPGGGVLYLDGPPLDFGKTIEVELGSGDQARTVFKGTISALEATFEEGREAHVRVFAEDALMKLRLSRRFRTYENMTDAQIAEELARLNGLRAEADVTGGPSYEYVQQWNQSDLAFLRERARLVNAEIWERDGVLHFKSRTQRQGTELTLVRGGDLISLQVRADLAHQRTQVTVSGYDQRARDVVQHSAGGDVLQAEISGGRTGPDVLARLGADRPSFRVRENPLKEDEARAFANAELLRRGRGFVVAVGTTCGTPDLEVGTRLTLERAGVPFSGAGYYVTSVRHAWTRAGGFRTHFEAERPTLSEAA